MGKKSLDTVHIVTHKIYFDRIFEPRRIALGKKLGKTLSQREFTKYIAEHEYGLKFPKQRGIPKAFRRR